MNIKLILFLGFFLLVFQLRSQNHFMTKKGYLKMVGKIDNQMITAESHDLELYLDYETKEIKGTLDLKSFHFSLPEKNDFLNNVEQTSIVEFYGIIPQEDFMSQPHEPLRFKWQVFVTFQNKQYKIILDSVLEHISQGYSFSCQINSFGDISSTSLGINNLIPDLDDNIRIHIIQTILKDNKNR